MRDTTTWLESKARPRSLHELEAEVRRVRGMVEGLEADLGERYLVTVRITGALTVDVRARPKPEGT
jgi:hypothetical protein